MQITTTTTGPKEHLEIVETALHSMTFTNEVTES